MKSIHRMELNLYYFQFLTICLAIKSLEEPGRPATRGQFPFMAQIVHIVDANSTYSVIGNVFGASLISPKWILTAGQCFPGDDKQLEQVIKNKSMVVVMGSVKNLDFSTDTSRRFIIRIIRHPNYQDVVLGDGSESISDDIAVAEVNKKFHLNKFIQTIALPSPSFLHGREIIDKVNTCTVMGFGRSDDKRSSNDQNNILTYIDVQLVSVVNFHIPRTANVFVSATLQNALKNHGDTGSPVICRNLQFGLVSATFEVGRNYVNIYTQIEPYTDFIKKYVFEAGLEVPELINLPNLTAAATTLIHRKIDGYLKIFSGLFVMVFCI